MNANTLKEFDKKKYNFNGIETERERVCVANATQGIFCTLDKAEILIRDLWCNNFEVSAKHYLEDEIEAREFFLKYDDISSKLHLIWDLLEEAIATLDVISSGDVLDRRTQFYLNKYSDLEQFIEGGFEGRIARVVAKCIEEYENSKKAKQGVKWGV